MKYVVPTRRSNRRRPVAVRRRRVARRGVRRRIAVRPYVKMTRQPVADKLITKLRYSEGVTFTLSLADVIYPYTFQSSIYDPDLTATGHQPLWRDTYATMYNRYRVNGIAYRITIKNSNASALTMFMVQHSSTTTTDTSINTCLERNISRKIYLDAKEGRANFIKGYLSVGKVYGMTRSQFQADDGFDALIGANPTKLAYLHLMTASRATAILQAQIELVYYVEFYDRINIAGS